MKNEERKHYERVASLGCIVCRNMGFNGTPAEIHHIRDGVGKSQRADYMSVIPLCPFHHRHGGIGDGLHNGRKSFEQNHGTERELLTQTLKLLGEHT